MEASTQMTLSKQRQDANMVHALALMLEQLGDEYTNSAQGVFDTTDKRFKSIHRSTWAEMEDLGYIRRDDQITGKTPPEYLFTPAGWYTAHDRLGHTQKGTEFVSKLARVSKALKDCIKTGNRTEILEHVQTIAEAAQVSYDFLCNVIDSGVIDKCFGQRGARWYGRAGVYISIPANYGLK
jgi:hypothetical protein